MKIVVLKEIYNFVVDQLLYSKSFKDQKFCFKFSKFGIQYFKFLKWPPMGKRPKRKL